MEKKEEEQPGLQRLTAILEEALTAGPDYIDFEYNPNEGWEVYFVRGHSGSGYIITDRQERDELRGCLYQKARLSKKSRGRFILTLLGEKYSIALKEYESFGERCYKLKIRGLAGKRTQKE